MISSDRNMASAVGGKSVRACDNCVRKRARWYCAADDAFLCQSCDSSVHSANPLARRHERVRLKTSSFKSFDDELKSSAPTWHVGFTRKARTPRQKKNSNNKINPHGDKNNPFSRSIGDLVPEICSEESNYSNGEENEEQLLYRVPIFDPELCTSVNSSNDEVLNINNNIRDDSNKATICDGLSDEMNHLQGFLPSEMDLAEFAADVESLLGKGLEDESFDMEGLGFNLDYCDDDEREKLELCDNLGSERVKIEDDGDRDDDDDEGGEFIDIGRETFELNFDYDSPITGEEEEEGEEDRKATNVGPIVNINNFEGPNSKVCDSKSKIFLRLNYDRVLSAWDDRKSPWTTGERPDLDSGECWPDCSGTCGRMHVYGNGNGMGMTMMSSHGGAGAAGDGGRQARVLRYREKRRTRLFSKKIRYEVRKLNAEKRPRMKGRFVKRSNFVAQPSCFAQ